MLRSVGALFANVSRPSLVSAPALFEGSLLAAAPPALSRRSRRLASRLYSTQPADPLTDVPAHRSDTWFEQTNPDGSPEISSRVVAIADAIMQLNMLECWQLQRLLQARTGVPDDALFGGGAVVYQAPAADAGPADDAKKEEEEPAAPTTFTIRLVSFEDGAKFKVLKEIRALKPGLSLTECKNLIDNLPSVLVENADKETVQKWSDALGAVGAQIGT